MYALLQTLEVTLGRKHKAMPAGFCSLGEAKNISRKHAALRWNDKVAQGKKKERKGMVHEGWGGGREHKYNKRESGSDMIFALPEREKTFFEKIIIVDAAMAIILSGQKRAQHQPSVQRVRILIVFPNVANSTFAVKQGRR